jgi:hypothetical protein
MATFFLSLNGVFLKGMLFIFFSFKPVTVSAIMEGGTLQQ